MYPRFISVLVPFLMVLTLAPQPATVHAAAPLAQLPLCGRLFSANSPRPMPPVLHLGARLTSPVVSERTGHTFVGLSGQKTSSSGATTISCHSSVMTVNTTSGRPVRSVALGIVPTSMAVDDRDGRVFVAGYGEATYPSNSTPALTILNTQGQVVRRATSFSPCPCAGGAMGMLSTSTDAAAHRVFVITLESVITFDALTGARLATVPVDVNGAGGVPNFAVDDRRHRVFVATGTGVTVIDARTGNLAQTVNLGQSERVLAVDTRTDRVFVVEGGCRGGQGGSTEGGVIVLDAVTGKRVTHAFGCGTTLSIQMDGPARRVLVGLSGNSRGQKYAVLDAASGRVLRTLTTPVPLFYARSAVEPGNGRIYFDTGAGSIQVLDPLGWRFAGRIPLPRGTFGLLTIASQTHRLLVTDPYQGTLRILSTFPPATG